MNHNEMFLISEDAYLKHIIDKVRLYQMVEYLSRLVRNLPSNRGTKELTLTAIRFGIASEDMFRSWRIPKSYCVTGAEEELYNLMDAELIPPDELGYFQCGEDCEMCCEDCLAQMTAALSRSMPRLFGMPQGCGKQHAMTHMPCGGDVLILDPEVERNAMAEIPATQPCPDEQAPGLAACANEEQREILDAAMTTFVDVLRTIFGDAVNVEVCMV